jgi:tol-pal system protein YbgF
MARALAAALLLAALIAAPARAALFDDDEARKRIDATNLRLTQVQKQIEDRMAALEAQLKSQGLVELFNQIELLKADVARLRGQIEVLNNEQNDTQKRQRDLYIDLDSRLRKIEAGASAAPAAAPPAAAGAVAPAASAPPPANASPPSAPAAVAPPPLPAPAGAAGAVAAAGPRPGAGATDVAAEQRAYDAALDLFKSGNYAGAITGFTAFVRTYPRSPLSPSAQYWIGNAQFAQKDFRAAIAAQRQLIAVYPDSQKVPDALLNIATSQFELGDGVAARRTLEDLVAKYPATDAGTRARARLAGR